jgi:hypothetical protein
VWDNNEKIVGNCEKDEIGRRRFILTISIGFEIINGILCSILHMKRYKKFCQANGGNLLAFSLCQIVKKGAVK